MYISIWLQDKAPAMAQIDSADSQLQKRKLISNPSSTDILTWFWSDIVRPSPAIVDTRYWGFIETVKLI